MSTQHTRRDILRGGFAVAGLGILGIPEWALPALAQGETLVPFTDPEYYRARKQGSEDDLSIAASQVVRVSGSETLGLHPRLAPLKPLFDEGKVSVVQSVGYEGQNLSHFRSTDIWLSGSDASVYDTSGWYARYLETIHPEYPGVLPADPFAIELGHSLGVGERLALLAGNGAPPGEKSVI